MKDDEILRRVIYFSSDFLWFLTQKYELNYTLPYFKTEQNNSNSLCNPTSIPFPEGEKEKENWDHTSCLEPTSQNKCKIS